MITNITQIFIHTKLT